MTNYVLGFSGFSGAHNVANGHHPAVALLKDGKLVAAAAEERFNRIKNAAGAFPHRAMRWALSTQNIQLDDLSTIAWANDPLVASDRWQRRAGRKLTRRLVSRGFRALDTTTHQRGSQIAQLVNPQFLPRHLVERQKGQFVRHFGVQMSDLPFTCVEHHLSHAASAFFSSGMEQATVITWDGSGDGISGSVRHGRGTKMEVIEEYDSFSIGSMYWCIHTYLKLSDEGSLMGLAAYGRPDGSLDPYTRPRDLWMDLQKIAGYHHPPSRYVGYGLDVFPAIAPPRDPEDELLDSHRNLAAELQEKVEAYCFEIVRRAVNQTGCKNLALSGGVALNAVVNGKLGRTRNLCDEIFVQPNAGDEGGALGAAYIAAQRHGSDVSDRMSHAYWGPSSTDAEIRAVLQNVGVGYEYLDDTELFDYVAGEIANGRVVGWVQGAMEWGPRALGNRSILADPRNPKAGELVNTAIKYRDPWRPFAPSILAEAADDFLEDSFYSPFMITTFLVRDDRRSQIPSVVHADGSTRPQMVTEDVNPRFYRLIRAFASKTGIPLLLNTSFNLKGEPIVNDAHDALRTFFSSGLDLLVMGNHLVRKRTESAEIRSPSSSTSIDG